MNINPEIKFKRVHKGYDPQEVDAVFGEFLRQIEDLKKQNKELNGVISKFNEKINQVESNTHRLEQERAQANLRVTSILDKAVRIAEETEREAKQKFDEMIRAAQAEAQRINNKAFTDTEATRSALANVNQNLQNVRQTNQQFSQDTETTLSDLDKLLSDVLKEVPAISPTPAYTPPPMHMPVTPSYTPPAPVTSATPAAAVTSPGPEFDYEQFLKDAGLNKDDFPHFPKGRDRVIGRFGD